MPLFIAYENFIHPPLMDYTRQPFRSTCAGMLVVQCEYKFLSANLRKTFVVIFVVQGVALT